MSAAALSTSSPLRALVSVANTTSLPLGVGPPLLQGQTQASASDNGTISIADLSLVAIPGIYNVSVVLPDYPQVQRVLQTAALSALLRAISASGAWHLTCVSLFSCLTTLTRTNALRGLSKHRNHIIHSVAS